MKTILLILFPAILYSQISVNTGVCFSPMLHTKDVRNLESYSTTPNFCISVFGKDLGFFISLGAISKAGTLVIDKRLYGGIYYVINTISEKVEHGAEIEIGYNLINKSNLRLFVGSSVGMLTHGNDAKIFLRPFNIGITFNIWKNGR